MRQAVRIGPVLAIAAIAGYVLGGCGGGDSSGLPSLSGVTDLPTGTRPDVTLPTLPTRTETAPGTTTEAPTTPPTEETPTEPTTTSSATETTPTSPPATNADTGPSDTGASEPPDDNGFLGWLALVLGLVAAQGETTEAEPSTTTERMPATTTSAETMTQGETVAPEPTSSQSDPPWGWIVLALGLALAAIVAGLVVWRRRRAGEGPSSSQDPPV